MAILLKETVDIKHLKRWLDGFEVSAPIEPVNSWHFCGPSIEVEFQPELGGRIIIDIVDKPWPGALSPQTSGPLLSKALATGCFGPFSQLESYPRALSRCITWAQGPEVAQEHTAFLRIRSTFSPDEDLERLAGDEPLEPEPLPSAYRANLEIEMMLALAEALLEHPKALCYFNPAGEVIAPLEILAKVVEHCANHSVQPLGLLANRRFQKIEDSPWFFMDTVGMAQLDREDLEICVGAEPKFTPEELQNFLLSTILSGLRSGLKLKDKHTIDGPKDKLFEARNFSQSLLPPNRKVVRLRPRDGTVSPALVGFGDKPLGRSAWWQFWKL